jgi:hypothetical protein
MSGKAAQAEVDGILNPPGAQGVKSLVSYTADLASSLVQSTDGVAHELVSAANDIKTALVGDATAIVGTAASGLKKDVYDFAAALIGGEQSASVVDAVFGGSVPEPVDVGHIGGLFGAATELVGAGANALDTARQLAFGVAGGVSNMAETALG